MRKLQVLYNGWGERWQLGTLLDAGGDILFEYAPPALERGLQLSPLHHPLPGPSAAVVTFRGERAFHGLPAFIADALPDGWGMLLMDRALRRAGRNPAAVSVLERLAVIGDGAIGALSFEPAEEFASQREILHLRDIARHVAELHAQPGVPSDKAQRGLLQLLHLGGSPQGARPKVLVDFNPRTATFGTCLPLTGATAPWLVKFPAQGEHNEVCATEELYARIARKGGLDMPRSRYFDLGRKYSAFGVERFDRVAPSAHAHRDSVLRIPVMSLSAMLQADHRLPSVDYETVLQATMRLTGDRRELHKAFERCVYNVLLHNRDDHSRNFAFRLDAQGYWKLAPVFDLTWSDGPGGEHSTSVLGHGKDIGRETILELGRRAGLPAGAAQQSVDKAMDITGSWPKLVRDLPVRKATLKQMGESLGAIRNGLRSS